jgi:hypothetical protein
MVRWIHSADSQAEYEDKLREYDQDIFENFYMPFFPQYDTEITDIIDVMHSSGIHYGGTVDKLTQDFVDAHKQVPTEFITLIWHYAQVPKEEVLRELDVFMKQVLPELEAPEPIGADVAAGGRT